MVFSYDRGRVSKDLLIKVDSLREVACRLVGACEVVAAREGPGVSFPERAGADFKDLPITVDGLREIACRLISLCETYVQI